VGSFSGLVLLLTSASTQLINFIDDRNSFARVFEKKDPILSSLFRPYINLVLVDLDFSFTSNFTRTVDTASVVHPNEAQFSEAFTFLRELTQVVEFNARRLDFEDLPYLHHYVPLPQLKALRALDIQTGQAYTYDETEDYRPYSDKVRYEFLH